MDPHAIGGKQALGQGARVFDFGVNLKPPLLGILEINSHGLSRDKKLVDAVEGADLSICHPKQGASGFRVGRVAHS